jgi:phosphotriesterase-related protein
MANIRTILGDIDAKDIGPTNAHDHFIRTGGMEVLLHGEEMRLPSVEKAIQEAKSFMAAGGKTLVEMNPIGLGRDIRKLLEVNAGVPSLNIVVTTGFHFGKMYDNATHWVNLYSVNQVADLLIAEIEEGIDIYDYVGPIVERSKAKAGCIKIGTGYGMITPFEEKFMHAAAIAQKETGVAINTHTQQGTMATEQAEILIKYGANPEKIAIGHVQRNPDPWYHKKIVSMGVNVMYDGGYRVKYWPDSDRVMLIRTLVEAGFQKRIILGGDAGKQSYQKAYGGGVGIDYDLAVFCPRMLEEGIPEDVIADIFVNNPARIFALDK